MIPRGPVLAMMAGALMTGPAPAQDGMARSATGTLRVLDKVAGATVDVTLTRGQIYAIGALEVALGECRYPADDPASEAYAYLTISDQIIAAETFRGWMVASAPGLNALDHHRYDVWVLRCATVDAEPQTGDDG